MFTCLVVCMWQVCHGVQVVGAAWRNPPGGRRAPGSSAPTPMSKMFLSKKNRVLALLRTWKDSYRFNCQVKSLR
jgi:hypothetical protein